MVILFELLVCYTCTCSLFIMGSSQQQLSLICIVEVIIYSQVQRSNKWATSACIQLIALQCVFAELGIYLHKACVSILICTMGGT